MSILGIIVSIILGLILLTIIIVLIAPFRFILDSHTQRIAFEWPPFGSAKLILKADGHPLLMYKILLWQRELALFDLKFKPTKEIEKGKQKKERKSKKTGARWARRKFIPLWHSFKLKELKLNLDTDDYCKNAYLFPLFHFLSNGKNRQLGINFNGESELRLIIENRIIRMIKAMIF